jgi:ribose 1,5-bisphosphokinase
LTSPAASQSKHADVSEQCNLVMFEPHASVQIGPGRLVLVVGPSGAGKDTLIGGARAACRARSDVVFPRRVITRPSSAAEDHDTISEQAFDQAVTEGAFAIWWSAHGLRYGIPRAIDTELQAGRTVVCNVSRTVVPQVRKRYANVAVVLVTAPPDVLAARLERRERSSDGDVADRMSRLVPPDHELKPDETIETVGTVDQAAAKLAHVIFG